MGLILLPALVSKPWWPQLISKQDTIDPGSLDEEMQSKMDMAIFENKVVKVPQEETKVLGEAENVAASNKRIEVDLTNQILYGLEDDREIFRFVISSGKWDRTPRGTYTVWTKIRSQKMSGGSKELGTYYYLPNVPYILFFYNDKVPKKVGYSIHGTYWHNNFGVPMSHGCINMKTPEAAQIYQWAEVGTKITVYGKYQPKTAKK